MLDRLSARGLSARFDHVAHAAHRIRDLLPIYQELLGGVFVHGGANPRVGYRAVQLAFSDGTRVELLEPLAGSTFLDRFFERNPRGGLHHVTFKIDDIKAAIATAEAMELVVVGAYFDNPRWQEAFLHPRGAYGALLQLVETDPNYPPRNAELALESVLDEA